MTVPQNTEKKPSLTPLIPLKTKQSVTVSPELSCLVQDTQSTAPTDTLWVSDEEGQENLNMGG